MNIKKLNIGTKFYIGTGLENTQIFFIEIIDIYLENDIIQIKHTIDGEEHVLPLNDFKIACNLYVDKPKNSKNVKSTRKILKKILTRINEIDENNLDRYLDLSRGIREEFKNLKETINE
jgi:hypothetical protein